MVSDLKGKPPGRLIWVPSVCLLHIAFKFSPLLGLICDAEEIAKSQRCKAAHLDFSRTPLRDWATICLKCGRLSYFSRGSD